MSMQRYICRGKFMAMFFIIMKKWKLPKYPLVRE